jgi:hypothetical protein
MMSCIILDDSYIYWSIILPVIFPVFLFVNLVQLVYIIKERAVFSKKLKKVLNN